MEKALIDTGVWYGVFDNRDYALDISLETSLRKGRPLSMVDCLLRLIIDDRKVKTKYLLTFNPGDFADVCHRNLVEIL